VCTLILGLGVPRPGMLVLGANRDESPDRPTAGPGVLVSEPRVVGGRDLVSGGTWLAVRESRCVAALLNRRPDPRDRRDPSTFRSRGLLCLDLASTPRTDAIDPGTGETYDAWQARALRLVRADAYGPCTLVWAQADGSGWTLSLVGGDGAGAGEGNDASGTMGTRITQIEPGWHVITHQDLDDAREPRTQWLLERLRAAGGMPAELDPAVERIQALLRSHGESGGPPVCLHRDHFPTVSSTVLVLGDGMPARYLHAPGPPCVTPYEDRSDLLEPRSRKPLAGESAR